MFRIVFRAKAVDIRSDQEKGPDSSGPCMNSFTARPL
jgi:hypothetical protein